MINSDEMIDLVDDADTSIVQQWRSKMYEHKQLYARAVLIFLTNSVGQLCVLRRASHKEYLPDRWALVGGCVQAGETYEQAAIRETIEEVNLVIAPEAMRLLGRITPRDYPGKFFKGIYEVTVSDENIPFNTEDFNKVEWMNPGQLSAFAKENPQAVVDDLLFLVERFYL